jgi:Sulfatase
MSAKSASWPFLVCLILLTELAGIALVSPARAATSSPPNILLVVVDDLGIDQWKLFGYGGNNPVATPNIDAIANAGVKFHNMWSMPACSNGRAALFTGRYPFRTRVYTAIGNDDLANYMVNPNEVTVAKLLKQRGYKSAMFGKFHLGTQANNPYGLSMVTALGWDYYDGWLDDTGDPASIDTTAGGVSEPDTWTCGFVRDAAHGGADTGACYAADNTCQVITKTGAEAPGRICRDGGGIFDPNNSCVSPVPGYINFKTLSGHYVSPLVIDNGTGNPDSVPPTDLRARTYRGIEQVDAAVNWINQQPKGQPWMASVTFAIAHTPLMQPPAQLLPASEPDSSNLDCTNLRDQNVINSEMQESLDFEMAQLLVGAGLATRTTNGQLVYNPRSNNTYVVFVTDNGSTGTVVESPFDPSRAKSTAYQTGVWVPAFVSGPQARKGTQVNAMVNVTDLYQLFGELAGIDVHADVTATVDAESMLPYLTRPGRASIRKTNYTELGTNQHADGEINGPCQYGGGICTQIAPTQGVCEDNNGIWWGAGATDPSTKGIPAQGFKLCCEVAQWQADNPSKNPMVTQIYPLVARAIRNKDFKLVVNSYEAYDAVSDSCVPTSTSEFYRINEKVPTPLLDEAGDDLLTNQPKLTPRQQNNYNLLSKELASLLASQPICPGDINLDGVVNYLDIAEWGKYQALTGLSSWADINQDGLTNDADLTIILQNQGICPSS